MSYRIQWHQSEDEPIIGKPIVIERKDLHGSTYSVDSNQGRWEVHRRINNIIRWVYIDDILPENQ